MPTQIHMTGSVRGVLMWDDETWDQNYGVFLDDVGSPMLKEDVQKFLLDELQQGHTHFQMNMACDRHDPKEGCLGHEISEKAEEV